MVFGNGVKNIQAAAYNGARTVSHLQGMKAERSRFVFFQAGQVKKNAERILLSVN